METQINNHYACYHIAKHAQTVCFQCVADKVYLKNYSLMQFFLIRKFISSVKCIVSSGIITSEFMTDVFIMTLLDETEVFQE